jgi:hypothetical protein
MNPKKALIAALPLPIPVLGGKAHVRPITLGAFALLERIKSPLITGEDVGILDIIPSLYLMTHKIDENALENLYNKSLEWADEIGINALPEIKSAIGKQMSALINVTPESTSVKKKTPTDG